MKRLHWFSSVVGVLVAAGGCDGDGASEPALTQIPCAGDASERPEVEIVRDAAGIAHVRGRTDALAYFGAGYAMAQDRLAAMQFARRQAQGRRAELDGAEALPSDVLLRAVDFYRWAELEWEGVGAASEEGAALDAWVAGVNARIQAVGETGAPYPDPETLSRPWTPIDVLAVGRLVTYGGGNLLEPELFSGLAQTQLAPQLREVPFFCTAGYAPVLPPGERVGEPAAGQDAPPCVLPALGPSRALASRAAASGPTETGSSALPGGATNAVAIAAAKTGSSSLLAIDPHQPVQVPGAFWLHHMQSAEGLDVFGASFTGTPGVQIGHNRKVAFVGTISFADTLDLFRGTMADGSLTMGDVSYPITERNEEFVVAGEPASTVVAIGDVEGKGVLIPPVALGALGALTASGSTGLLLRWVGMDAAGEFRAFYGMNKANTLDQLIAKNRTLVASSNHWLLADATEVAYQASGRIPARPAPAGSRVPWQPYTLEDSPDALWPYDIGDTPVFDDFLPSSRGGSRGWLVAANQDPTGASSNGDPLEAGERYYGHSFAPGLRARRLEARVEAAVRDQAVSLADLAALLEDDYSVLADTLIPKLARVQPALPPAEQSLVSDLIGWDRRMRTGSREALAFALVAHALSETLEPFFRLGPSSAVYDALQSEGSLYLQQLAVTALATDRFPASSLDALYPGASSLDAPLVDAVVAANARLAGSTDVYGDVHRVSFGSSERSVGGAEDTVAYTSSQIGEGMTLAEGFRVIKTSEWRMLIRFVNGEPEAHVSLTQPLSETAPDRTSPTGFGGGLGSYQVVPTDWDDVLAAQDPAGESPICFGRAPR